jgi:hypothetical protein
MQPRSTQPQFNSQAIVGNKLNTTRGNYEYASILPVFLWNNLQVFASGTSRRRIRIEPFYSASVDPVIVIPFRIKNADGTLARAYQYEDTQSWLIDLDTSTINTTTRTGGLIDSIALAASSDYFVWAFYDHTKSDAGGFQGIGVTLRPRHTGITVTSGGGLGASTVLSGFTVGHGHRYPIGCRVLVREGTTGYTGVNGSDYNQGIVTATTSTTITVTLDTTYDPATAVGLVDSNATVATSVEVIQLDHFQPLIVNTTAPTLYGGFQYCYLGMLQTDSGSNISDYRYIGDRYTFPDVANYLIRTQTLGVDTRVQQCLARYIPFHVREVYTMFTAERTLGAAVLGHTRVSRDAADHELYRTSNVGTAAEQRNEGNLATHRFDCSISTRIFPGGATILGNFFIQGYIPEGIY